MKNKSKLKKIREKSQNTKAYPKEWLYLNTVELTPRQIAEVFDGENGMSAQLWEAVGVVEVELLESKSVDFELVGLPTGEEEFDAALEERRIKSLYLVTIAPEEYARAKAVMLKITGKLGGYFCGDNADMQPVVR